MIAMDAPPAIVRPASPDVIWAPQPGSQELFLTCPVWEVLFEGTRGPGKTDALLMSFAQFCGQGFGEHWRGVLFRQSYPQLADVVAKSKKWFYRIFPGIRFNHQAYTWTWPTGEELLLRHMKTADDYWNYHGHEYPWIGFEELTNWATLDAYNAMKACSRSSHPGMPRMYRSTSNPYGRGHNGVKRYFRIGEIPAGVVMRDDEGNERVRIHGHWSENKRMLEADPNYPKRLAADINPRRKAAWLEGSWAIQAGGMFDDVWESKVHLVDPFTIPAAWWVDRSHDWGSSKPFASLWFAESNGEEFFVGKRKWRVPRGSLFVIGEDYGWNGQPNQGCNKISRDIARSNRKVQDALKLRFDVAKVHAGPGDLPEPRDGQSPRDEMLAEGMEWLDVVKGPGSRTGGWELVRTMLKAALDGDPEKSHLYVFRDQAPHLVRTLPELPRDEKNPDDIDTEAEDHAADALRYRLISPRRRLVVRNGGV